MPVKNPVKYSASEQKVLCLLKTKPQTSTAICRQFYSPTSPPFYGQQIIVSLLSSLMRKAKINREKKFKILKTKRMGPKPISYWYGK